MNRHLLFGILFLSFSSLTLSAQETTRQWISATYEAFESKQSTLKLSQRFRWREQEFHQWITEVDYKTDLGNGFSGGLELRYLIESDRRGAVQGNRSSGRLRLNLYHEVRFSSFATLLRAKRRSAGDNGHANRKDVAKNLGEAVEVLDRSCVLREAATSYRRSCRICDRG